MPRDEWAKATARDKARCSAAPDPQEANWQRRVSEAWKKQAARKARKPHRGKRGRRP